MTFVTISALYGAGGSIVAPAVARRLDVPLLTRPDLPAETETSETLLSRIASLAVSWGTPSGMTTEDLLPDEVHRRELEREVRALAATGGGVVLGRGAAALLRDHPGVLHVLLDGAEHARVRQAMVIANLDEETAARRLARADRARRAYLEGLYGVDGRAPGTFQLTLDSTVIALDDCVEIIIDVARRLER